MIYLNNAPIFLQDMHENNKEGQARKLLGMLLSDSKMIIVWDRLGLAIKTNSEWLRFWQGIKNAIYHADPKRKSTQVKDEKDELKKIAKRASELAKLIKTVHRSDGYSWHCDLECHHFFPGDVMKINGIQNWSGINLMDQYAVASKVMTAWPSMAQLLNGLEAHALEQAKEVKSKRTVLRCNTRRTETMFLRKLYAHLSQYQWKKKDPIYVSMADIANIAIDAKLLKGAETVTPQFARKAVSVKDA